MDWKKQWLRNRRWLQVIIITAIFSIGVRLLIEYRLDDTALLYVAIPYLIALTLAFFRRREPTKSIVKKYLYLCIDSLIVMLASSILLFEGFVCVVMFMPIYFIVVFIAFGVEAIAYRYAQKSAKNSLKAHVLPYLFLLFSVEGLSPDLSFPRDNAVSVTQIVSKSPIEIQQNLLKPMELEVERHWFLSIFPMPYHIEAESLNPGDIHQVNYRYHRWFFTNTHEGRLTLQIDDVSPSRIKTTILNDTSYLFKYLDVKGTEILLTPHIEGGTEVKLTVFYKRKLDPAWYFHPVQEFGVSKMAEFLIDELMEKG